MLDDVVAEDATTETGEMEKPNQSVAQRLAHRIAALDAILRIAKETRPDPDGLTVVDYLRDIRDPDWEPEEDE